MPHTERRENVVECPYAIAFGEITVGCECNGMLTARSMSLKAFPAEPCDPLMIGAPDVSHLRGASVGFAMCRARLAQLEPICRRVPVRRQQPCRDGHHSTQMQDLPDRSRAGNQSDGGGLPVRR